MTMVTEYKKFEFIETPKIFLFANSYAGFIVELMTVVLYDNIDITKLHCDPACYFNDKVQ